MTPELAREHRRGVFWPDTAQELQKQAAVCSF